MKFVSLISWILLFLCFLGSLFAEDLDTAIQIVTPVDHKFQLELEDLKRVLEVDEIKDRHVVVVSIAGEYRKGKSFLLNFFLKYLYAQVKSHLAQFVLLFFFIVCLNFFCFKSFTSITDTMYRIG